MNDNEALKHRLYLSILGGRLMPLVTIQLNERLRLYWVAHVKFYSDDAATVINEHRLEIDMNQFNDIRSPKSIYLRYTRWYP